jgi:tRNA(fMet)-specific endonuclease VapC
MKYVLDTNVLSALMKGDARAVTRLKQLSKDEIGVPQPALAEIAYGIARLTRSKRKEALQDRFDLLRTELPRVAWSDEVSESFGSVKALLEKRGERIEDFDAAIAAHALALGAVLVTADMNHMVRVPGLVVEDWTGPLSA